MNLVKMSPLYPLYVSIRTILAPLLLFFISVRSTESIMPSVGRASCAVPELRPEQEMRNHHF